MTGGLGLWESRRFGRRAAELEAAISEQRLQQLAAQHGGALRAEDVAEGLSITRSEAEELLDRRVDEIRVSMQVTEEGEIRYVFRELNPDLGPRVRVAEPELEEQFVDELHERVEKLGLTKNDYLIGCPLCLAVVETPGANPLMTAPPAASGGGTSGGGN